jgi:hypothetical protein
MWCWHYPLRYARRVRVVRTKQGGGKRPCGPAAGQVLCRGPSTRRRVACTPNLCIPFFSISARSPRLAIIAYRDAGDDNHRSRWHSPDSYLWCIYWTCEGAPQATAGCNAS